MCSPFRRASWMRPSGRDQSNRPSSGSTTSQARGTSSVLRFESRIRFQIGAMAARLDDEELFSSPPRMRNGLPRATSCVALR